MNRKSSPLQSSIRTVQTPTRGQTPPPASQLRGSHIDDQPHYPPHFPGAGGPYQPSQPTFVDMNKPATARVSGPGLAQPHQGFNVPRGQHQSYGLVGEGQDQSAHMWNQQQGSYYLQAPSQPMRHSPRMQTTMNNSQVAFMPGMGGNMPNMAFIPSNMAPGYSGNHVMPFMQNPGNQFVQRMPFAAPMPQQQQMGFMPQYGPTSTAYAAAPTFFQPPMAMANTSRPSSAGPQGAMGGGPKPPRNRKILPLTDPTTGEDLTEKVFRPASGEELDPSMLEFQAHREAVQSEFATKVAFLAKDKNTVEGSHAIQITAPPPEVPPVHPPTVMEEPPPAAPPVNIHEPPPYTVPVEQPLPVINGEPETNIPEQVLSTQPPAPYPTPAKKEFEPPAQPLAETVAAAAPDVQTPSPALPSAPVTPAADSTTAPASVAPSKDVSPPRQAEVSPSPPPAAVETTPPPPVVEKSPPPQPPAAADVSPAVTMEKEPTPPVESATVVPAAVTPPEQSASPPAADAAKVVTERTSPPPIANNPNNAMPSQPSGSNAPPQAQAPQQGQPQPQPQPQRDSRRGGRKNKRELNKKTKEGSDMDAFYDPQPEVAKQESASVTSPEETSPKDTAPVSAGSTSPPPTTSPAAAEEEPQAAAASAPSPVEEPSTTVPETEAVEPPAPEQSPEPEAAPSPAPEPVPSQPEVSEEPAPKAPSPAPQAEEEAVVEEASKEEGEEEEEGGRQNGEAEIQDYQSRLMNGLGITYKEGQWSPLNPEGKKQYDREFLLKLQANPECRKPPVLPDMPDIVIDPKLVRTEDFQRAQLAASRSVPDFTPGFFKSYPRSGPSLTKRNSQQRGRGPGSQTGEQQQQRIIISNRQEVQLHKADNAYRPNKFQNEPNLPEDEKETQTTLRTFQGVLNKLTPEKFSKLVTQALELKIDTEARLVGVTNLIFEKAIAEQKFATVYADLCRELLKLPKVITDKKEVTFRGVLLTKCQKEFEKDKEAENKLESSKRELEAALVDAPEDQKARLEAEYAHAKKMARHRSTGNIRFIGELYRLKMLTENIMHDCIFKLLKMRDDDSIECLTKLLDTVGADLDHPKAKQRMDQYFAQLEKMTADMRVQQGESSSSSSSKATKESSKLSSRVKFGVLDILDLRKNNWVKRRIHDQNKPTTLGAIHQKAKEEEQAAQFLNSQPRPDMSAARGGARPKGRGSAQGDVDGWNTVPARQVKQQIEPTRMKLTKTNVDVNNVTLGGGNKFQNWGRGSQGGGSRSQEQEKLGNRYNALNSLGDSDSRRGYGRSPARGDSRGSGRMDRDHDRRDRDRDYRKPPARSSMEEKERALANTRSLLGAAAGSNPSSRNASRDNSRSRDTPPEGAAKQAVSFDASKMSADELDRRINTITEEFVMNPTFKDTMESIAELKNLDYSRLVMGMLEKLVEKSDSIRTKFGEMLFRMVREKMLTIEALIGGLAEFLQFAEDLELDVPKIWDYLAEVVGGLVVDNKVLPLSFLQACVRPLVAQGNGKEVVLVTKTLRMAADSKGKEVIQAQWAASGLKLSDFGLNESEMQWLKGSTRSAVYQELLHRLRHNEKDDAICQWIEKNMREEKDSNAFIRELMSSICRTSIDERKQLNPTTLKNRVSLVRRYVDTQEKGTQALFGIQHLMSELEHPQGLVRNLFETLYDEELISEESFFDWEARDGPPEDMVGKGVVKMNLKSFFDWLRSSNEDERTS